MNTLLTAAPHIHPHATLAVGDACLVYQGLLVNSYCTSDLCRLPGLARPSSASCAWSAFGHSTMSDQADAWFPRPSTPPATRRQKDDTHHGLPRCPLTFSLIQEHCARVLCSDAPAAQTACGGRAPAREDDSGGLRPWRRVEGQPWVPDGSTVGPRFLGGNRGFPHKNRQPWVPATSFLFCVRWATRPNCQPLTLSHLESDGGPTASMPSAARPHCILPARNLETLTIF